MRGGLIAQASMGCRSAELGGRVFSQWLVDEVGIGRIDDSGAFGEPRHLSVDLVLEAPVVARRREVGPRSLDVPMVPGERTNQIIGRM